MKLKHTFWPVFENTLPWVTLALTSFYVFSFFVLQPYTGFYINLAAKGWLVTNATQGNPLLPGDVVTRVGTVSTTEAQQDLSTGFFNSIRNGETVEIKLERNGQSLKFNYTLPGMNSEELLGRLNSQWFMSFIFWLAGCAAMLFLRPRGLLRRMFMLFCFLTAAWLSTGMVSGWHFMGGALVLRFLVWLSVPVYLHLHWLFPTPLGKLPGWVWGFLYSLFGVLAVASLFQLLPQNLYLVGFILAILGSLVLLVAHLVKQPAERRALAGIATSFGLILLPVAVMAALSIVKIEVIYSQIATLGLVALPGFYFFTLYIRQLAPEQVSRARRLVGSYFLLVVGGLFFCLAFSWYAGIYITNTNFTDRTLVVPLILVVIALLSFVPFLVLPALADERVTVALGAESFSFSANRSAPAAIFLFLQALAGMSVYVLIRTLGFPGAETLAIVATVLVIGLLGLLGFAPFQRFFERRILGMVHRPESLVNAYSNRILTSLDEPALRSLLVQDVLPSLLVRQSALLRLAPGGETAAFLTLRVSPEHLPSAEQAVRLAGLSNYPLSAEHLPAAFAWVRAVVPLRFAEQLSGLWLFGARDPDDAYSGADLEMLNTLAAQTALALSHIDQANHLRALYLADGRQREAERLAYAAELHDAVLNPLAAYLNGVYAAEITPQLDGLLHDTVQHIRRVVKGLRPEQLNYGLYHGLRTQVDDLEDNLSAEGPALDFAITLSDARLDEQVELNLFRIVQQACQNAIRHAGARTIRLTGEISAEQVWLCVQDDGKGFDFQGQANLAELLTNQHYGLAGMHERALTMGAEMEIQSQPGQGCRVKVSWKE